MKKVQKVLVAHPGKQHVFQLLTALKERGILYKFITTVYDKDSSLTGRLKGLLKGKNLKKASSRRCAALADEEVLLFSEAGGLLLILLGRLGVPKKISTFFYNLIHRRFAKRVAEYALREKVDAVVMFDSTVFDCFDIIKKHNPSIRCILDVTIANRLFMKGIYEHDMAVTNSNELYKEQIFLWDEANLKLYRHEFERADYLLVGSEFVKKSIIHSIGPSDKIVKIPYGVDIEQFKRVEKDFLSGPLRLFFVGGIIRRKGVHHLVKAVSAYTENEVVLSLAGGYTPNSDLYSRYRDCQNIHFEGFVTRDVVAAHFANSHVFLLPSLAEGLALVGLEALASGLPVLCTENSGVNDLIANGENGFVIPASDEEALKASIDWFLANRDQLEEMSRKARASVLSYTWNTYAQRIGEFFTTI